MSDMQDMEIRKRQPPIGWRTRSRRRGTEQKRCYR